MGSCNRANPWSGAQVVESLPPVPVGASGVGRLPGGKPPYQTNLTLKILYRSPRVLH